jgi:hypothetical protein
MVSWFENPNQIPDNLQDILVRPVMEDGLYQEDICWEVLGIEKVMLLELNT